MSTTEPAPAGGAPLPPGQVTRAGWGGHPFPPDVQANLLSKLLTGSPFANALQPAPTTSGVVTWPLVSPEGAAWLAELQQLPLASLGDEVYSIGVCKLGTIIQLSEESITDASFNLAQAVGRAIADSCGPLVDDAFLYGAAALSPKGVWAAAPEAAEAPDFRSAVIAAWGELAGAGSPVESIIVATHPTDLASEWSRTTGDGLPLHTDAPSAGTLTLGPGIRTLAVPMMHAGDVLAFDASAVFRVVRSDFAVELSREAGFATDSVWLRVKGRLAVAAPTPEKSLRRCTIAGAAAAAAKASAPAKK
jgi:HK97 family phage major capsid protein